MGNADLDFILRWISIFIVYRLPAVELPVVSSDWLACGM